MTKESLIEYIKTTYPAVTDTPFENDFDSVVCRVKHNGKWFALFMSVPGEKFNYRNALFENNKKLDVVNVKCPVDMNDSFVDYLSVFPAYHMNKTHWVSVVLQKAEEKTIKILVDMSFNSVSAKKSGTQTRRIASE